MLSVIETADAVRTGRISAVAVVTEALERIKRLNGELNSFVHIDTDGALAIAAEVDAAISNRTDPLRLAGVPFGVKDLDDCIGMPTSLGSLLFKGGPPADREPPLVARLRAAGAIPVGKTATPEFGDSAATFSRAWGVTRNPWRLDRTPGGSSGGSAAAVASGAVPFATGTDVGGSIRSPASFCGLVGLKPSHGLIPGDGRAALGQFVDDRHCWGVLTSTVLDTALLLSVVAGPFPADRYSAAHRTQDYVAAAKNLDVSGLRVAWSEDLGFAVVDPTVARVTRATADRLIESAQLERMEPVIDLGEFLEISTASRDMRSLLEIDGLYPARAGELGSEVLDAIEHHSEISFSAQGRIMKTRAELQIAFARIFEQVDVVLTPATACVAFGAEDRNVTVIDGRDATKGGAEAFGRFANACWLPAISVPAGIASDGLPIGLQIIGPFGRDDRVIRLARILELSQPWPINAPVAGLP